MLYLTQVFVELIDFTASAIILFFGFTQSFLHLLLLRVHSDEFLIIVLRSGCNGLGFFLVLLELFRIKGDAIGALLQAVLLETNLLLHALHSILLLVEENILLIEIGRLLAEQFILCR